VIGMETEEVLVWKDVMLVVGAKRFLCLRDLTGSVERRRESVLL
jgi:hypothetical protein